jgi:Icc-related predicted phosphoesterase
MKFLIIGDLHGNMPEIYYKDFDAIIAPGDFCSDALRDSMFAALREQLKNPKSKLQYYDILGRKKAKVMIQKSLYDGRKILERLNSFDVPVYIVPGNWDWTQDRKAKWNFLRTDHYKGLVKGLKNIVDVYHRKIDIGDYLIIGHGITSGPEYPQYKEDKKRLNKKKLEKAKKSYNKLFSKVSSLFKKTKKPIIYLSHNVPFNTPIDMITNKESPRYGYHYGSLISRKIIDKHQPLVCIGGHMHEHFTKCNLGSTVCINAGFGSYVNIFMELKDNKIRILEFHKGN